MHIGAHFHPIIFKNLFCNRMIFRPLRIWYTKKRFSTLKRFSPSRERSVSPEHILAHGGAVFFVQLLGYGYCLACRGC